jgi:hypothetical protein
MVPKCGGENAMKIPLCNGWCIEIPLKTLPTILIGIASLGIGFAAILIIFGYSELVSERTIQGSILMTEAIVLAIAMRQE